MTDLDDPYAGVRQNRAGLTVIPRELFASRYFHYDDGQHAVFGGPSTKGKTTLAFKLLKYAAIPQTRPAYVAVSKPKDPATFKWGKELGFRFVPTWPAPRNFAEIFGSHPQGYIIYPKFGNLETDMANAAKVTRDLLNERYTAGVKDQHGILVMDDTMVKAKVMGLDGEMVTLLAMAGGMGMGMWTFVQKPTDSGRTPLWSYTMSHHKFFRHDGVRNMRKRYAEIADMNEPEFSEATASLEEYEFLYTNGDGELCIVGAD